MKETIEFAKENEIGIIPLRYKSKFPRLDEWKTYQRRKPTAEEIRNWFREGIKSNIGYVCGEVSGNLVVIDFDKPEFYEYVKRYLPDTTIVKTKKGFHVYFRTLEKTAKARIEIWKETKRLGNVDIQGEGSYVVAPGSIHEEGIEYVFVNKKEPFLFDGDLRQWLYDTMSKYASENGLSLRGLRNEPIDIEKILKGLDEGNRNEAGIRLATWYRKMGKTRQETLSLCLEWNKRNKPPLTELETTRTVFSAYNITEPYNYEFVKKDKGNRFFYPTKHLPYFNDFKELLGLKGEKYRVIEKTLYYSIIGALSCKNIEMGNIRTDTRIPVAIALPSGKGKKNIKNLFEVVSKETGLNFSSPTSLHPEQLVGKTILKKKGKEETIHQIKGHLADDIVLFEEGLELIRAKDDKYAESRAYISIALDPIGQNEIAKRMVDFQRDSSLRYVPECTVVLLFQPYRLNEEVALQGLLRRFLFPYIDLVGYDFSKEYEERLKKREIKLDEFISYLKWIRNRESGIIIKEFQAEKLKELHLKLIGELRGRSEKSSNFINITDFTLQDIMLKLASIIAIVHGRDEVDDECLEFAYADLFEIYSHCMQFVEKKVHGMLDYGNSWGGASSDDRSCLEWLADKGALSYETSTVGIKEYEEAIAALCNLKSEGARRRFYTHRNASWIKSWKGKHESKVWLVIEPPETGKHGKSDIGYNKYWEVVERIENLPF